MTEFDAPSFIRANRGTARSIAKECDLSTQCVLHWKRVPASRIPAVSKVTGLSARIIRPDLAALFEDDTSTARAA